MMLLVILLSMSVIYSTLSVMRHQIHGNNCHLHLNLNLNYVTLWIGARSGLLISMLEKLNLFCLISLITLVLLIWKWVHLFLRCWNWFSLLNSIGAVTLSLILKLSPRKLELWFFLWSFFLLKLLCISINIWFSLAWNNVVMSGLVLQTATRKC